MATIRKCDFVFIFYPINESTAFGGKAAGGTSSSGPTSAACGIWSPWGRNPFSSATNFTV